MLPGMKSIFNLVYEFEYIAKTTFDKSYFFPSLIPLYTLVITTKRTITPIIEATKIRGFVPFLKTAIEVINIKKSVGISLKSLNFVDENPVFPFSNFLIKDLQ